MTLLWFTGIQKDIIAKIIFWRSFTQNTDKPIIGDRHHFKKDWDHFLGDWDHSKKERDQFIGEWDHVIRNPNQFIGLQDRL